MVDPTELCLEGAEALEVWWAIMAGISGIPSAPRSFSQCSTTCTRQNLNENSSSDTFWRCYQKICLSNSANVVLLPQQKMSPPFTHCDPAPTVHDLPGGRLVVQPHRVERVAHHRRNRVHHCAVKKKGRSERNAPQNSFVSFDKFYLILFNITKIF